MPPGLLLVMAMASAMADGELTAVGEKECELPSIESGRDMGKGDKEGVWFMGCIASGLAEREVLVGGMDETEMRLPREELFETAEAGVIVSGMEVMTCCFGRSLANALVWDIGGVCGYGFSCGSAPERVDGVTEFMLEDGWR